MIEKNQRIENVSYSVQSKNYTVKDIFTNKPNFGTYKFLLKEDIIKIAMENNLDKSLIFFIQKKLVAYINFIQEIRNETVHGRPATLNVANSVRAKILGVAQESVLIELVKNKKMITK